MDGISPRYVQDKISNALVSQRSETTSIRSWCLTSSKGLKQNSLITNEDLKKHYTELLVVKQEYDEIVKNEVQRAISLTKKQSVFE